MNAVPRYRQIAEQLRETISRGEYAVGTLLPTESDICATYSVSRHTAREALRILSDEGMVERRQGHGTRVVAALPHLWERNISSVAELLQYGANTRLKIVSSRRAPAIAEVAELLDCPLGTRCVHLHGLRSERKGERPFCVTDIYRVATADALTRRLANVRGAVYAIIDELAIEHIGRVEQRIGASHLDAASAQELGSASGEACLRIVRRYFDANGAMLMVAINLHRADDYTYSMELKRA